MIYTDRKRKSYNKFMQLKKSLKIFHETFYHLKKIKLKHISGAIKKQFIKKY